MTALLGGILVGLGGVLTAIVALLRLGSERRHTDATTDSTIVQSAVEMAERLSGVASSLVVPLREQLTDAQTELGTLRERIARLEGDIERVTADYQLTLTRERELVRTVDELQARVGRRRATDTQS